MLRPRIGITTSYENGKQILDGHYVRAVEQAGGLPLIVPLLESARTATAFAALLDGLIMVGGPGITTGLIGELPDDLPAVDPARDQSDRLIYATCIDLPILGICYGMQFINAQAGGTIYADLMQQHDGAICHSDGRGAVDHPVYIEPDTHLGRIFNRESLTVNTYHIQAVSQIGDGLQVSGRGPDGIIEGIESPDGRLMGVQFHPERMGETGKPLFDDFVQRCAR